MSLRLQGVRAIGQAVDAARGFGAAQRMAKDDLARLCIVVEELIANLYDHGGVTERDDVQLTLCCDPMGIRISIVDPGMPFNSWSTAPTFKRENHGGNAGIRLIQAWAQLVSYDSSSEGNRLELLLPVRRQD